MVHAQIAGEVNAPRGQTDRHLRLHPAGRDLDVVQAFHPVALFAGLARSVPPARRMEVIEVFSTKAMQASNHMVFLRGRFGVQNKVEEGLFYRMENTTVA